jgi:hypothetical protein
MKRLVLFAMALAVACIMPSCGKDPKPNDNDEPTAEKITFGNYEGMDVVKYDNIEWEYYEESGVMSYYSKEFDVNGDGTNDFSIGSKVSVDPNSEDLNHPRYMYSITLRSSSNLKFHSQTILNEVYLHVDSTIYPTDSIPLIYLDYKETCNKLLESDPLQESYNLDILVQHEKDDMLNSDDSFVISPYPYFILYESNMEFPYLLNPEVTEATVYVSEVLAWEECYNLPIDVATYIGIKYVEDSRTRIGWIKLIIEYNANGDLIARPLEAAIQKEYIE